MLSRRKRKKRVPRIINLRCELLEPRAMLTGFFGLSGLEDPDEFISFDEVALAEGALLSDKFSSFGVTFDSGIYFDDNPGADQILNGAHGRNAIQIGGGSGDIDPNTARNPFTIQFQEPIREVAIALMGAEPQTTVTVRLDGVVVDSVSGFAHHGTNGGRYFGFTGIEADELVIATGTESPTNLSGFVRFDNLQYSHGDVPDILAITLHIGEEDVFISYDVAGQTTQQSTWALYWASGPGFSDRIGGQAFSSQLDTAPGIHSDTVRFSQMSQAPPQTTHLLFVLDPQDNVQESNEQNNIIAKAVVLPPTFELVTVPSNPTFGEDYTVHARITNNQSAPINMGTLDWTEDFVTVPMPDEDELSGTQNVSVVQFVDIPLKCGSSTACVFNRTWEWIPEPNPFKSIPDTLGQARDTILGAIAKGLDNFLEETPGVINKLGKVVSTFGLIDAGISSVEENSVRYVGFLDWGSDTTTATAEAIITVPLSKQGFYWGAVSSGLVGGVYTTAAIASLKTLRESPKTAIAGFLGGIAAEWAYTVISDFLYEQAIDPPDSNFTEIVVPVPMSIPELENQPSSIWKRFGQTAIEIQALKAAEAVSRDRALGAALEGDSFWQSTQLIAAADFGARAASLEAELVAMSGLLDPYVQNVLAPHGSDVIAELETNGLPDLEVRLLRESGWTSDEIEVLRESLVRLGPDILDDPSTTTVALKTSVLVSTSSSLFDITKAVDIRVDDLGLPVRDLTVSEIDLLTSTENAITHELESGFPSNDIVETIESYIAEIRGLMLDTNNIDALASHLDFAYSSLLAFQQFEVDAASLATIIHEFVVNGQIANKGIANSLQQKTSNFERKMTDGEFDAARGILGAFINELRAQKGKHVSISAAEDLLGFASYIHGLLGNSAFAGIAIGAMGSENGVGFSSTVVMGDSNSDNHFDQKDILQVLKTGKYLTGTSATWSEGDWNGDGVFDQFDIITALQTEKYLSESHAPDGLANLGTKPIQIDDLLVDGLMAEFTTAS